MEKTASALRWAKGAAPAPVPGESFADGEGCPSRKKSRRTSKDMTLHRIKLAALAAIATLALCLAPSLGRGAVITKDYGSGSDSVHLLLQFAQGADSVLYTYHFTYSSLSPLTGAALFLALDSADSNLTLTYSGTVASNFYITSIAYSGYSEPSSPQIVDGYSWNYFDSGGLEQAYDSNFDPIPNTYNTVTSGSWSLANVGASDRFLQPGSWDAWVLGTWDVNPVTNNFEYTGDFPSVAPVPEPTTVALLALGGLVLLAWRKPTGHAPLT
jgi:hypothetical protein